MCQLICSWASFLLAKPFAYDHLHEDGDWTPLLAISAEKKGISRSAMLRDARQESCLQQASQYAGGRIGIIFALGEATNDTL